MWSLILYFLFGIGQPTASTATQPTVLTSSSNSNGETPGAIDLGDGTDGDGGEKGNVRPPRK